MHNVCEVVHRFIHRAWGRAPGKNYQYLINTFVENKISRKERYFLLVLWVINIRKQIRNPGAMKRAGGQTEPGLINNLCTREQHRYTS
jgi:hypothetical protein